jgi:hypothetical protein
LRGRLPRTGFDGQVALSEPTLLPKRLSGELTGALEAQLAAVAARPNVRPEELASAALRDLGALESAVAQPRATGAGTELWTGNGK